MPSANTSLQKNEGSMSCRRSWTEILVEIPDAAVISQIWGTYLRAISTEMKLKEQLELQERLETLEEGLEQTRGRSRTWRA